MKSGDFTDKRNLMKFRPRDKYRTSEHRGKITIMALFTDKNQERCVIIHFYRKDRVGLISDYKILKASDLQRIIVI